MWWGGEAYHKNIQLKNKSHIKSLIFHKGNMFICKWNCNFDKTGQERMKNWTNRGWRQADDSVNRQNELLNRRLYMRTPWEDTAQWLECLTGTHEVNVHRTEKDFLFVQLMHASKYVWRYLVVVQEMLLTRLKDIRNFLKRKYICMHERIQKSWDKCLVVYHFWDTRNTWMDANGHEMANSEWCI